MRMSGKQRLTHFWVTCDRCGKGRWLENRTISALQSPGHHCKGCCRYIESERRILDEFPNAIYDGRWKVPITCPDCKETRLVRAIRARRWGTEHLCKICTRRRIGYNSKIGIRTDKGKTCSRCKTFKPYSEFRKRRKGPDGFQCRCKDCDNVYKKKTMRVRVARTRGAGGSFSTKEWEDLCVTYGHRCLACGRDDVDLTADHIIPVSKNGSSDIENIQPLCQMCNSQKGNQTIDYRPS